MVYDFANLDEDESELGRYHVKRFIISPNQWKKYPMREHLSLAWNYVKFGNNYLQQVPDNCTGVYSFIAMPGIADHPMLGYLLYVGSTERQSFRARYKQYLYEPRQKKPRPAIKMMIDKWGDFLYFYYATISEPSKITQAEEDLLEALIPPQNRTFPACIRSVIEVVLG